MVITFPFVINNESLVGIFSKNAILDAKYYLLTISEQNGHMSSRGPVLNKIFNILFFYI